MFLHYKPSRNSLLAPIRLATNTVYLVVDKNIRGNTAVTIADKIIQ